MIDVGKIINILRYCGPMTYKDLIFHSLQGEEDELIRLVKKGILIKKGEYYHLSN